MGKDVDYKNLEAAWQRYTLDIMKAETDVNELDTISSEKMRLLYGIMGLSTEANELLNQMKNNIFDAKPLSKKKIREELGDVIYYMAILCNAMELQLHDILYTNKKKLLDKYPHKFTPLNIDKQVDYEVESWLDE